MNSKAPYSSDLEVSDQQIEALKEVRRSDNKNVMRTRARIEEVQERLRRERELDYAC